MEFCTIRKTPSASRLPARRGGGTHRRALRCPCSACFDGRVDLLLRRAAFLPGGRSSARPAGRRRTRLSVFGRDGLAKRRGGSRNANAFPPGTDARRLLTDARLIPSSHIPSAAVGDLGKLTPEGFRKHGPGARGGCRDRDAAAPGEVDSWKPPHAPNTDAIRADDPLHDSLKPGALSPVLLPASKCFLPPALFCEPQ